MASPSDHELAWSMIDCNLDANHDDRHRVKHSGAVAHQGATSFCVHVLKVCHGRRPLTRGASSNQIDDRKQNQRTHERDHQSHYAEVTLIDRTPANEWRNKPAAKHRPDNSDDDIENDALCRIGAHDEAGEPTDDAANDQPYDEIDHGQFSLEICQLPIRETPVSVTSAFNRPTHS